MARRSKSSDQWLREHFTDPFVKRAHAEGWRSRIGKRAGEQEPQVFLRRDNRQSLVIRLRGDDHLGEDLDNLAG